MEVKAEKEKKPRKTNARRTDVVVALIEERLNCIVRTDDTEPHWKRISELTDELKRSLKGGKETPEESE